VCKAVTNFRALDFDTPFAAFYQDWVQRKMVQMVIQALSADRFATYLTAAGHNHDRAQKLYIWKAQIGEAFHTPIQAVEVALRNGISRALTTKYGHDWWMNQAFLKAIDENRETDLNTVRRRIENQKIKLVTGQIVAGLSFGFWVGMLQRRYNSILWASCLGISFPDLPQSENRNSLLQRAKAVAQLRNRISHHEPIFSRDISADYAAMMLLLKWISPAKHDWIRPHCRVQEVLRRKP
jgi:hypothetical protein